MGILDDIERHETLARNFSVNHPISLGGARDIVSVARRLPNTPEVWMSTLGYFVDMGFTSDEVVRMIEGLLEWER